MMHGMFDKRKKGKQMNFYTPSKIHEEIAHQEKWLGSLYFSYETEIKNCNSEELKESTLKMIKKRFECLENLFKANTFTSKEEFCVICIGKEEEITHLETFCVFNKLKYWKTKNGIAVHKSDGKIKSEELTSFIKTYMKLNNK